MKKEYDLVIVGAGSAGLAAANGAYHKGVHDILIIERDIEYGGILNQCIHNGFGLHTFKEELSGPSYAETYYDLIKDLKGIEIVYDTTVIDISEDLVLSVESYSGYEKIKAKAIIMAGGCKERSAFEINLKGDRPIGVYTAGAAQRYLNMDGILVGKKVFILGSGDIGLIMARRMTLEGAKVIGVAELMPYSNGLPRNIKQCLEDFDIPLHLSHTVTRVNGYPRLESINLAKVDDNLKPIKETEETIECDALLLSVGLIPDSILLEKLNAEIDPKTKGAKVDENYMSSIKGIFSCGNALHVHDLVDFVSAESYKAGEGAASYILENNISNKTHKSVMKDGISYVVPQSFDVSKDIEFAFRVNKVFKKAKIHIYGEGFDKTISKLSLIPSEMEKVMIRKEDLKDLKGELYFEVIS